MSGKLTVQYNHDSADLTSIYIAVTDQPTPSENEWQPALRGVVDGRRVVWIRESPTGTGNIWLRDRNGERMVGPRPR